MMTGDDLRKFRERRGLDRADLADLLNRSLGKQYRTEAVSRWERGEGGRPVPRAVQAFLEDLAVSGGIAGDLDAATITPPPAGAADELEHNLDGPPAGDTAPGPGPTPQPAQIAGPNLYARTSEEQWEMIAMGLGMIGAATGSHALIADGQIIAADKTALGAAYGRLAETNDTFRRMLVGMTEGGAWLQVAMVTGTTVSKCWQSHVAIAESHAVYLADLNQRQHEQPGEPAAA